MIRNETHTIPGSKGRLMLADLTYNDADPNAPLIIFSHGFKGFKDWGTHHLVANYFAEHGYRVLKFNFSHNGTTPDTPFEFSDLIAFSENTFSIELDDLKYVIDFAAGGAAMPVAEKVILLGHSMGGGISIVKAAEDPRVSALITMASVASFRNLWPKQLEAQWKIMGMFYFPNARTGQQMPVKATLLDDIDKHSARLNVLAQAANVTQPWLIAHGTADTTVAVSHAHDLKSMQPNAELLIIPNADHTFDASHPYFKDSLPAALHQLCKRAVTFLIENGLKES
ncbi:alpha/beta hydrolase family protein [Mucilaginibacter agri]|uniref:Alpha/beta fold hydrolase n=1 Tax=Mucilaginibacter agri TaxID=2695265 RepID=A0A966DWI6_9SPHI|nr:alpha/beta hydrolase [Mucilaginibacter agri]NCD71439.1 alpha/beta fold hydrolase [Mucilaginibacter agri]